MLEGYPTVAGCRTGNKFYGQAASFVIKWEKQAIVNNLRFAILRAVKYLFSPQ
jgi:hypothetical protein